MPGASGTMATGALLRSIYGAMFRFAKDGGSDGCPRAAGGPAGRSRGSGPTPGATNRPCWTPPPPCSSPRAWMPPSATSPPPPASGWARSTATSRPAPTSSSPSTATRSTRAPRPVRLCWRAARRRTARWRSGSDLFVDFLVTKHGLAAALQSDGRASTPCTPISSTGSCPCAPSCSMPRSPPARSAPMWTPTGCCAGSATSASAPTTTRVTTRAAWSGCSSPGSGHASDQPVIRWVGPKVDVVQAASLAGRRAGPGRNDDSAIIQILRGDHS